MSLSKIQPSSQPCVFCGRTDGPALPPELKFDRQYYDKLASLAGEAAEFVKDYLDESIDNNWHFLTVDSIKKIIYEINEKQNIKIKFEDVIKEKEIREFVRNATDKVALPISRIAKILKLSAPIIVDYKDLCNYISRNTESTIRENPLSEIFPISSRSFDDCYLSWLKYSENNDGHLKVLYQSVRKVWRETAYFLAKSFGYRVSNYTFFHLTDKKDIAGFVFSPEWLKPFAGPSENFQSLDPYKADYDKNTYIKQAQGALIRRYAAIGTRGFQISNPKKGEDAQKPETILIRERSFDEILTNRTEFERKHKFLIVQDGEMSFRILELYAILRVDAEKFCKSDQFKDRDFDGHFRDFCVTMGLITNKPNKGKILWGTTPRAYRMLKWIAEVTVEEKFKEIYSGFLTREPFLRFLSKDKKMQDDINAWLKDCDVGNGCQRGVRYGGDCCNRDNMSRLCEGLTQKILVKIFKCIMEHVIKTENECMQLFNIVGHAAMRRCNAGNKYLGFPGEYLSDKNGSNFKINITDNEKDRDASYDCCSLDRGLIAFPLFDMSGSRCFVYVSVVGVSEYMNLALFNIKEKSASPNDHKYNDALKYILELRHAFSVLGMPFVLRFREYQYANTIKEVSSETTAHDLARASQASVSIIQTAKLLNQHYLSDMDLGVLKWLGICSYSLIPKSPNYLEAYDIAVEFNENNDIIIVYTITKIIKMVFKAAAKAAATLAGLTGEKFKGVKFKSNSYKLLADNFIEDLSSNLKVIYSEKIGHNNIWYKIDVLRSIGQALLMSAFFGSLRHMFIYLIDNNEKNNNEDLTIFSIRENQSLLKIKDSSQGSGFRVLIFEKFIGIMSIAKKNRLSTKSYDSPLNHILSMDKYKWEGKNKLPATREQIQGSMEKLNRQKFDNDDDDIVAKNLIDFVNESHSKNNLNDDNASIWYLHVPLPSNFWSY